MNALGFLFVIAQLHMTFMRVVANLALAQSSLVSFFSSTVASSEFSKLLRSTLPPSQAISWLMHLTDTSSLEASKGILSMCQKKEFFGFISYCLSQRSCLIQSTALVRYCVIYNVLYIMYTAINNDQFRHNLRTFECCLQ